MAVCARRVGEPTQVDRVRGIEAGELRVVDAAGCERRRVELQGRVGIRIEVDVARSGRALRGELEGPAGDDGPRGIGVGGGEDDRPLIRDGDATGSLVATGADLVGDDARVGHGLAGQRTRGQPGALQEDAAAEGLAVAGAAAARDRAHAQVAALDRQRAALLDEDVAAGPEAAAALAGLAGIGSAEGTVFSRAAAAPAKPACAACAACIGSPGSDEVRG